MPADVGDWSVTVSRYDSRADDLIRRTERFRELAPWFFKGELWSFGCDELPMNDLVDSLAVEQTRAR